MRARTLGIAAAIFVHLAILFLGGLLFFKPPEREKPRTIEDVDLVESAKPEEQQPAEDPAESEEAETMEVEQAPPPDVREVLASQPDPIAPPALSALSLGDLASVLDPSAPAAGGFGVGAGGLASGGRIGGTGASLEGGSGIVDAAFELGDLDERPRPIFQGAPAYPHELRQQKTEGLVYVLFLVDPVGRVVQPKVEKSTHDAFKEPALEAVRRWRFAPAVRNGQKVQCKMRVPIRFTLGSGGVS